MWAGYASIFEVTYVHHLKIGCHFKCQSRKLKVKDTVLKAENSVVERGVIKSLLYFHLTIFDFTLIHGNLRSDQKMRSYNQLGKSRKFT